MSGGVVVGGGACARLFLEGQAVGLAGGLVLLHTCVLYLWVAVVALFSHNTARRTTAASSQGLPQLLSSSATIKTASLAPP
jgi:hypothetical protein